MYRANVQAILKGSPGGKLINLTGDKAVLDLIMEKAEEFITNVLLHSIDPESETIDFRNYDHPWVDAAYEDMKISSPVWDEGIAVATQVAYTGEGVRLYDVGEPVKGSASVVSHYLTTGEWQRLVLHRSNLKYQFLYYCSHRQAICGMSSGLKMALTVHGRSFPAVMASSLSIHTAIPTRPQLL